MQVQTLNLSKKDRELKKSRFWERQFQVESTRPQKIFDALFGVILPAVCFLFDPIVFRTGDFGHPLGGEVKSFAYLLSFVSIMGLFAFMLWGEKLKWFNGFLSGLFAVSAIISMGIGIVLFPFSLIGIRLLFLIGILGFTPLLTGFVYWRNWVRAYKISSVELDRRLIIRMATLAGMFALILPALINVKIEKGLDTLQNGNADEIRHTAQILKYVAPLTDFSRLHLNYENGKPSPNAENEALRESYEMLAGRKFLGDK